MVHGRHTGRVICFYDLFFASLFLCCAIPNCSALHNLWAPELRLDLLGSISKGGHGLHAFYGWSFAGGQCPHRVGWHVGMFSYAVGKVPLGKELAEATRNRYSIW